VVGEPPDPVAEASRLHAAGELDRAEAVLRAALASASGDARLHHLLGLVLRDGSPARPSEAIAAFAAALELDASLAEAAAAQAQVLLDAGRAGEAERFLRARLADRPDEVASLHLLGGHLMRDGRAEEGEELLTRAARIDPLEPAIWLELGRGRLRSGNAEGALPALETAIRLAPAEPAAHYALGQAEAALGRSEAAATELQAYLRLEEERKRADQATAVTRRLHHAIALHHARLREQPDRAADEYSDLLALHAEAGSIGEARDFLEALAAARPDLAAPVVGLALAARRDDDVEAWDLLRRARETQPRSPEPLRVMSSMATSPERRAELGSILQSLDGKPGAPLELPLWLGLLALDENRLADAERELRRALEALPDDPEVALHLGVVYGVTGRHREAVAMFTRAVELQPDDSQAWFNLALSEAQLGEIGAAREHLGSSLAAGGDQPRVLNLLARILAHQGERQEAIALLERSLALEPDQAEFRKMLEDLRAAAPP
jgi:tetratricopeptide (TPR) repeat protein